MKKITFLCLAMLAFCWQGYAQDTCATATPVTPGTITGTTINPGTGGADMTLPDGTDAAWFVYTATADGTINVNACGGGADTDLGIGTGTCGALTDIAVNDDSCDLGTGSAWASEIDGYAVVAGNDYYIEWSNEWSDGPFDWSLTFTPTPACNAPVTGAVTVDDTGCDVDGTFLVNIEVTDAGDAGSVFDDGTTTEPVVAGIVTMGPYNSGDLVTIDIVALDPACSSNLVTDATFICPQPHDTCDTAEAITPGTYTTILTPGSNGGILDGAGDSAFFLYTPAEDGEIYVNSCLGGVDSDLFIGSGPCNDLTLIGENDDSCPFAADGTGSAWASEVTIPVTAGTTYTIEWAGTYTSSYNEFTWSLAFTPATAPPANDTCGAAEAIACNETVSGDTTNATNTDDRGNDVWYSYTDTVVGDMITASLCGSSYDTHIQIYDACGGTVVASNDDSCGVQSEVSWISDGATTYLIRVDGFNATSFGAFDLTVTCNSQMPPANDDAAGAIDLPMGDDMCETPVLASNEFATTSDEADNLASCSSSDPSGDVWYKVTVPASGSLTVETSATDPASVTDTVMIVYRGTPGSLIELQCDDDDAAGLFSQVQLSDADGIAPGDVLYVRVWEWQDNFKGVFNVCAWDTSALSIDDNTLAEFSYYPNPVKNTLTLNAQNTIENVTMYNMLGQEVLRATPNNVDSVLDMSALSNGAYFVQVTIANVTQTVRVIKQ